MSNAVAQEISDVPTDPNTIIELNIVDRSNAGRSPASRWGRVSFDSAGNATIKVPLKDVATVHGLHWLSAEDQERYLGLSQEVQITATTSEMAELQSQLDATKSANTRLASRNAELEAQIDAANAKFNKEFAAYQKNVEDSIGELEGKYKQQIAVLTSKCDEFEAQLNALTAPPATPAASPATQTSASKAKSGK